LPKSTKNKKLIIWSVVILALLALVFILIFTNQGKVEKYSDGYQTIELYANGSFSANLYHGVEYKGNFSKSSTGSNEIIVFTVNDATFVAPVINNVLNLPSEWRDSHGHGSTLKKQ